MSTILGDKYMSLVEANKRKGYDRNEGFLLELAKQHHALDVLPFLPASDNAFHSYNQATLVGQGAWRDLNEGRESTYGSMESITTPVQLFSAESNISDDVLRTADAPADTRDSENLLVATGLVEDFMSSFVYSDGSDPKCMKGLVFYRPKLGEYCIDGGGTSSGSLTSMYIANMGKNGVNVRYNPKLTGDSHGIGLKICDEGAVWKQDKKGRDMKVWKTTYDLTAALEVRQNKSLVRIANIDPSGELQLKTLIKAIMKLPTLDGAVIFAPKCIEEMLINMALTAGQNQMRYEDVETFGPILKVMGVPVLIEEAILTSEAQLTA